MLSLTKLGNNPVTIHKIVWQTPGHPTSNVLCHEWQFIHALIKYSTVKFITLATNIASNKVKNEFLTS